MEHAEIFFCATAHTGHRPPDCWSFEITHRHTTLGRIPLKEWSARRSDVYLTTRNTHKRQTSVPPAGFETAIPASERRHTQTYASGRAATQIGTCIDMLNINHQRHIFTRYPYHEKVSYNMTSSEDYIRHTSSYIQTSHPCSETILHKTTYRDNLAALPSNPLVFISYRSFQDKKRHDTVERDKYQKHRPTDFPTFWSKEQNLGKKSWKEQNGMSD